MTSILLIKLHFIISNLSKLSTFDEEHKFIQGHNPIILKLHRVQC